MSLKKIVERKKREKYAWPVGWMTREQAANDIGCSPRDVDDTLREALADGDVQKQFFSVYDSRQHRVVRMPGYRVAPDKGVKSQCDAAPNAGGSGQSHQRNKQKGASIGRAMCEAAREPGTRICRDNGVCGTMGKNGEITWDNGVVTRPADMTLRKLRWG